MKSFDSIQFVDGLAEITRHLDKDVIERSLLQTLCDFSPAAEYRIYRVLPNPSKTTLALVAYAKNNFVDTLGHEIKDAELPDVFFKAINRSIETQSVQIINKSHDSEKVHIIYPAIDKNSENIAILVQSSDEIDSDNQRLVHGLLNVYSNYLELIDKASRDKLTQLLNRETLDAEITRILIRNNTSGDKLIKAPDYTESDSRQTIDNNLYWLGVLDIDFFKKINDTYGHVYGDEILILVARLLEKNIRSSDFAFRYGGEEFVIILMSNDFETAKFAFERIRIEINEHPYANVEDLSVSIGITQITNQINTISVVEEADKALYYGKKHGRNQTQFYVKLVAEKLIEENIDAAETGEVDFF